MTVWPKFRTEESKFEQFLLLDLLLLSLHLLNIPWVVVSMCLLNQIVQTYS